MEYSLNINYFTRCTSLENAAKAVAKAGFSYLDYSPKSDSADWKKQYKEALDIFDTYGLKVYQTHSPMFRYTFKPAVKEQIDITLEATVMSGGKYMVVHGDEFEFDTYEYSPEKALEYNHDLFEPFVKKAEKLGVKIAFETVFEDYFSVHKGKPRFSSKFDDLKKLIDSFNSPAVCCCWDFGHAQVEFKEKQAENIRAMGSLIECMHMHDSNFDLDTHLHVFAGEVNWKECLGALKETGYNGIFNLEFAHGKIPEPVVESFAKYTIESARFAFSEYFN